MVDVATRSPAEGLEWVRKELSATFSDARTQLQKFADNREDMSALTRVSDLLHSAHGALRMVEVYGGALLVEEMVSLSRKMGQGEASIDDGLEVLSRAIVQLPGYLDRVAGGGHDVPLVLLPLLNDLRAVRGSPLLSESSLFVLNIDQGGATPERARPPEALDYKVLVKKLRPHYQRALLGWLRGEDARNNLGRLGGVAAKLEAGAASSAVYQFWWILGGVIEAVQESGLMPSAAIKRLLGQADAVLKKLAADGEEHFVQDPPRNLTNNLLYYVARAESDGKRVLGIKNSFSLSELLEPGDTGTAGEHTSLQGPSVELMKTVGAAIKQDVGNVKDAIDVFVRTQSEDNTELEPQRDSMKKLGDTLGMLGLDALRQQVTAEARRLHTFIEDKRTGDDELLQIAATLINVENAIDEQLLGVIIPADGSASDSPASASEVAAQADRKSVTSAVLRECVVNLTRIKEMLSQYVDNPENGSVLDSIPRLIVGIRAGLNMLEKERASDLLSRIEWHINAVTNEADISKHTHELDRLADAIVSIEYYMETIRSGRSDPWYMLDNAERCLESITRQPVAQVERPGDAQPLTPEIAEATGVREASQFNASSDAARRAAAIEEPLSGISGRRVDPELLELFIEEAKEEVANLRRAIPRWKQDPANREVLLTMRRSFHTLKGSGRMVGAMLMGEYAWSFENLVNKIVGHDFDTTPEVVATLEQAVEGLPALVEQLEVGTPSPASLNSLMETAWRLVEARDQVVEEREHAERATPADEEAPAAVVTEPGEALVSQDAMSGQYERVALHTDPEEIDFPVGETGGESASDAAEMEAVADEEAVVSQPDDDMAHTAEAFDEAGEESVKEVVDSERGDDAPDVTQDVLGGLEDVLDDLAVSPSGLEPAETAEPEAHEFAGFEVNESQQGAAADAEDEFYDAFGEHAGEDQPDQPDATQEREAGLYAFDPDVEQASGDENFETGPADDEESFDPSVSTIVPGVVLEAQPHEVPGDHLVTELATGDDQFSDVGDGVEAEPETTDFDATGTQTTFVEEPPVLDDFDEPALVLDPALQDIFLKESLGHLADVRQYILDVSEQAEPFAVTESLHRAWHTLAGSANTANVAPAAAIATPLNQHLRTALAEGWPLSHEAVGIIGKAADQFEYLVRGINSLTEVPDQSWLLEDIETLPKLGEAARAAVEALEGTGEVVMPADDDLGPGYDPEIAAIFAEEADEILDASERALSGWFVGDADSPQHREQLLRHLHTLKGGARMAGITAMGDLSHETESLVEHMRETGQSVSEAHERVLRDSFDHLHDMTDKLNRGVGVPAMPALINALQSMARGELSAVEDYESAGSSDAEYIVFDTSETTNEPQTAETALPEHEAEHDLEEVFASAADAAAPDEVFADPIPDSEHHTRTMVDTGEAVLGLATSTADDNKSQDKARIDARLLDEMLNNAGEVSIFHSRLEEQVGSISFNLTEHQQTVLRLREQLRKLEIETEAQILHRHQDQTTRDEEFDPLELDRYSGLQQLSRALAESVSDLASLQDLMTDITRESESLLVQQARVTGELQDALIRSRMLPFSQYVSRFERVVRQAASEQGKSARLVVTGASGELDRQVLQRMLPPFEHMLRNAVIHGIEPADERASAGKSEQGTITIDLTREGAEMVIRVIDDGRGLNAEALVSKARALNILDVDKEIDDRAAFELIFAHGFSTADSVTQSAGRGVGMDVVANEVKELGGSIQIDSEAGQQTEITIRLPLTLAVSQALLVRCGSERFAIPLPAVQGVVRAASDDVLNCLEAGIDYEHEGVNYSVRKLSPYLGGAELSAESLEGPTIPLIMVRAGDQACALLVDELLGSREVVVKSAGPMVSGISGVAGATILGDGSIVVILDVASLIRNATDQRDGDDYVIAESSEDLRPVVLVVDDSITVRRVTQRLLERNSMKVLLAKDGVDAVASMQEQVPDLVLLDIEMPRMDGYEVASHIRNTEKLQHVPICMITSRVGEKHRARAFELGVDKYLGKPYQENQLLDVIQPLLARAIKQRN